MTNQNAYYQDLVAPHNFPPQQTPAGETICSGCGLETIEFQNPEGKVAAAMVLDWPRHKAMYFTLWNGHLVQVDRETFDDPDHIRGKQAALQTA